MWRIAWLAVALALPMTAQPAFRFHYDASESANVVYQVACMGGQVTCTRSEFDHFWQSNQRWTPKDQDQLDAWSSAFQTALNRFPLLPTQKVPFIANYLSFYPRLAARSKILQTLVETSSAGEFRRLSQALVPRKEADVLLNAVEYFRRRLHPWWEETGKFIVTDHIRAVEQKIRGLDGAGLAGKLARFTEVSAPNPDVWVHAIAFPSENKDHYSGTVATNHVFMEVVPGGDPGLTASVVFHELFHSLYDSMPLPKHIALMQEFENSAPVDAGSLYEFLNEGVATAINVMLAQQNNEFDEKDDYSGQPYISRLGVSTAGPLKDALNGGKPLLQGFVSTYIETSHAALAADVAKPRYVLAGVAILAAEKNQTAKEALLAELQPLYSVDEEKDLRGFSDLSVVRLMTFDELAKFAPDVTASGRGFAYSFATGAKSRTYVLAGRDVDALIEVAKRFAQLAELSEGVLFGID